MPLLLVNELLAMGIAVGLGWMFARLLFDGKMIPMLYLIVFFLVLELTTGIISYYYLIIPLLILAFLIYLEIHSRRTGGN